MSAAGPITRPAATAPPRPSIGTQDAEACARAARDVRIVYAKRRAADQNITFADAYRSILAEDERLVDARLAGLAEHRAWQGRTDAMRLAVKRDGIQDHSTTERRA